MEAPLAKAGAARAAVEPKGAEKRVAAEKARVLKVTVAVGRVEKAEGGGTGLTAQTKGAGEIGTRVRTVARRVHSAGGMWSVVSLVATAARAVGGNRPTNDRVKARGRATPVTRDANPQDPRPGKALRAAKAAVGPAAPRTVGAHEISGLSKTRSRWKAS